MNIVKQILDQLSGDALGQLSSLLGTDTDTTERAATAAVPSLLAVLARMTSTDDGARKVANVLSGLDTGGLDNISHALGGNASSMISKGNSLLGSLGDTVISGLTSTLSRFTGLNTGTVKNLLAYLVPLVFSQVAAQWKSHGGTSDALKSLFADQRENITNAVPAGLSLADIPGLSQVGKSAATAARKAMPESVSIGSPARWLIPAVIVLLGGYFLWQYLGRREVDRTAAETVTAPAEEVAAMKPVLPTGIEGARDEVDGMFRSLEATLSDIQDAASAERAMPALRDLNTRIDSMNEMLSRLPDAGRAALRPVIEQQFTVVADKANAVSSIQGIGAESKALIQEVLAKISKWISAENE